MQSLFKKKKSKKKEDENDRLNLKAPEQQSADKDARRSLKILRTGKSSKTISSSASGPTDQASSDEPSISLNVVDPTEASTRLPRCSIDDTAERERLRDEFISTTQCEKAVFTEKLGRAGLSGSAEPERFERTLSVRGSDIHVKAEFSAFVLSSRTQHTSVASQILPGDLLVSVNGTAVEGLSRQDCCQKIESTEQVQLVVSSLTELAWMIGHDVPTSNITVRQSSTNLVPASARSELELKNERSFIDSRRAWLIHRDGILPVMLLDNTDEPSAVLDLSRSESTRTVKLANGDVVRVDDTDLDKVNPDSYDLTENLVGLRHLNESSVMNTLLLRFRSFLPYTHAGRHLISINPGAGHAMDPTMAMNYIHRCRPGNMPPHPYAIAHQAQQRMTQQRRRDQTILPLGISGSGKSFVAGQVLTYLSSTSSKAKGCGLTAQKVSDALLIMKSFSCAANAIHDNATRSISRVSLNYDANCSILGANIQTSFFEKTLVAIPQDYNINFHIFYQLWFGADRQLRKELGLLAYENSPERCLFLPHLAYFTPKQREEWKGQWLSTCRALHDHGVGKDEEKGVWMILAVIIHLGMAGLSIDSSTTSSRRPSVAGILPLAAPHKTEFLNRAPAAAAARLLGCDVDDLLKSVLQTLPVGSGNAHAETGGVLKSKSIDKVTVVAQSLAVSLGSTMRSTTPDDESNQDSLRHFAIGLYEKVFSSVSRMIQRAIEPAHQQQAVYSIHVVDTPGLRFSGLDSMVAQRYEDLCHNYTQERLQAVFHDIQFEKEINTYAQESIKCSFISTVPAVDPIVDAFDRYHLGNGPAIEKGIWQLVEEELSADPSSRRNNTTLLDKMKEGHGSASGASDAFVHTIPLGKSFFICHGQSHIPIEYAAAEWGSGIYDNLGTKAADWCLKDVCEGPIAAAVDFGATRDHAPNKRASSMRSPGGRRVGTKKVVSAILRHQVDTLVETVSQSKPQFIFCIRPQSGSSSQMLPILSSDDDASRGYCGGARLSTDTQDTINVRSEDEDAALSHDVNLPYVRLQIRKSELISAVRLFRQGFPERISYSDFNRAYSILSPRPTTEEAVEDKIAAHELLDQLAIDKSAYRLGCSKIFFKSGILDMLASNREKELENTFVRLQALIRGMRVRRQFQLLKVQLVAIRCVQKNVRKLLKVREWPWWKLYTKVVPLLDVHRQDEELKAKDGAITTLQSKCDRLTKELADYGEIKLESGHLQDRVRTLTTTLAEEQAAHEQSNDILEQEQMERLRLEQDLTELKAEHTLVVKQNEQLGLQAAEAMLSRHAFEEHQGAGDTDDGESITNMRIRVLDTEHRRALDSVRAELEQEREENAFTQRSQEKQIVTYKTDLEESYHKNSTMKKKMLRLESELADLMSHLEDEQQRNSVLERKQRRFDADLSSALDSAKQEKSLRETISTQKESEFAQRRAMEAKLEAVEAENEKLRLELEKVREEDRRVERNGIDDEVYTLRKEKRDLTLKVEEQDEELEELASKVHILEQARTRLETGNQLLRQQHQQDNLTRDEEREATKASNLRRVRALEKQLEDEYLMRQNAIKSQRELENQLVDLRERSQQGNPEAELRLRKHLHRTMALLDDAQMQIMAHQKRIEDKSLVKNFKAQLEEVSVALSQAKRSKSGVESDLDEATAAADVLRRAVSDLENRLMNANKANIDLEGQIEEAEEDLEAMSTKLKSGTDKVASVMGDMESLRCQLEDAKLNNSHLKRDKVTYETRIKDLEEALEARSCQQGTYSLKIRDLDDRLVAETAKARRYENTVARLKEQVEYLTQREDFKASDSGTTTSSIRESSLRETIATLERQEDQLRKKVRETELARSTAEVDLAQSRRQVQQATERIAKLHEALRVEDDLDMIDDDILDSDSSGTIGSDDDEPTDVDKYCTGNGGQSHGSHDGDMPAADGTA